ncbi:Ig-like domain repeat protein [Nocardioides seonyuensis]|uniref:Ig-like domain repeat protein n=1 Tax=Nocardioides seonyuensis TaxID=2518371 RepID=A0A4P7IDS2_9ACTN|nr:Ig-like domain-containing protein [Nocardioides seonyuensis]QBX55345.1 Ig-like domain repeat protein [Nocardioides seonyuensis]
MKKLPLALTAMTAIVAGLLAPGGASASAGTWNDGFQYEDQMVSCATGQVTTGVSANVGWMSPTGAVPKVGEVFWLRGYAGLVGMPCSSGTNIIPEIMVPDGIEFAEGEVRWDISKPGEQVLTEDPISADPNGQNGGIMIGNADETPFKLRQGEILEFQFPVRATRELKGPATQQPQCQSRIDGDAPCPISQSGDHFQVAFLTNGHGGDRWYVTPFVGLFATDGSTPPPTTPPTTNPVPGPGTTPTPGTTPAPAPAPGSAAGQAASSTSAKWKITKAGKGKATITVTSGAAPVGGVIVKDKGRTLAKATLKATDNGRVVIKLPRLRKGKHVLVAQFRGSSTVAASVSPKRVVRLR